MTARHRNRRRRRGRAPFLLKLLCLAAVLAAVVGALTMFFRIERIETEGNARYTDEELIAASGVQQGDNLVLLNKYNVQRAVFEKLPYVETISIYRRYPDTLVLSVTECTAAAALPGEGGQWLISSGGKLLEQTGALPEDCVSVTGCTLDTPAPGAEAVLSEENSYKLGSLLALLQAAEDRHLLAQVGEIDLSDGTRISFTYLDRFTVYLAWDADMERVFRAVQEVVAALESNQRGEINLMNLSTEGRAYFIEKN